MRRILSFIIAVLSIACLPAVTFAHVVVKPAEVGVAAFQTFTMGVPNEKEVPVTALRLIIPAGLQEVSPTVKPGWEVTTKKSGDTVTEITWRGGTIPVGMRDDFTFSAQAPASATTLPWKAYQTYADDTVVSWDQAPTSMQGDDGETGPYSTTAVVDDLSDSKATTAAGPTFSQYVAYVLAVVAIILSSVALLRKTR